jgi:hypothetical protein
MGDPVRAFLLHHIEVDQLAYASYRQVYAALKFLYSVTLGRPGEVNRIPFPKRQLSALPKVLTVAELTSFFAALRRPDYRALFMTCYAAGRDLPPARAGRRFATHGHPWIGQNDTSRHCSRVALRWSMLPPICPQNLTSQR